jgi:hypothetical protein
MDNQEALDLLKAEWCNGKPLVTEKDFKHCDDLEKATQLMQELVEKVTPKKMIGTAFPTCGSCGLPLKQFKNNRLFRFCPMCGQAIEH